MISECKSILLKYWGYNQFRPLQEEIIQSIIRGDDTLALLPTGGGKSICFQVPALYMDGFCLVVSPLIALMKDQVEQLRLRNIPAACIISGMSYSEIDAILENAVYGKYKLLYVSPERLGTDIFRLRISRMQISFIAVDEAHCISQWGYDFRPSYLRIAEIRSLMTDIPVLALTASATAEVRDDICLRLNFTKNSKVFVKSFARANLNYLVYFEDDKRKRLIDIISKVDGSGIIYVRTRKHAQQLNTFLNENKVTSDYYHAGLTMKERDARQKAWMNNSKRIVIATNAFGMGIDKSNVRFVIHMDIPDNVESYYQEAGRAGRDGKASYAIVLYNKSDLIDIEQRYKVAFPDTEDVKLVYRSISNYCNLPAGTGKGETFNFELAEYCNQYNISPLIAFNAIKSLEMMGYISLNEGYHLPARIMIKVNHNDLYRFQVENPEFDLFIKTLLRSYAGLFDDYVKISETLLAKRLRIKKVDVVTGLQYLMKVGLIDYREQTDDAQLTFIHERINSKQLESNKLMKELTERYRKRALAMFDYIVNHTQCRSTFLLAYFGEHNSARCGICDYCRQRNKIELNDLELSKAFKEFEVLLSNGEKELSSIIESSTQLKKEKALEILQWMIDQGRVKYTEGNLLKWIK